MFIDRWRRTNKPDSQTRTYGNAEFMSLAKENEDLRYQYVNDPEYGLVNSKPVFVCGQKELQTFLTSLKGPDGMPVTATKAGSLQTDNVNGRTDFYNVTSADGKKLHTIFVNEYVMKGSPINMRPPRGYYFELTVEAVTRDYYEQALSIMARSLFSYNPEFELLPLMYVVADLASINAHADRRSISERLINTMKGLILINSGYFNRRITLYGNIIRGQRLRAEWLLGNGNVASNGVIRSVALFGDIMVNPQCAEAYDTAPIVVHGADDICSFATVTMRALKEWIAAYYNCIYITLGGVACKEQASSARNSVAFDNTGDDHLNSGDLRKDALYAVASRYLKLSQIEKCEEAADHYIREYGWDDDIQELLDRLDTTVTPEHDDTDNTALVCADRLIELTVANARKRGFLSKDNYPYIPEIWKWSDQIVRMIRLGVLISTPSENADPGDMYYRLFEYSACAGIGVAALWAKNRENAANIRYLSTVIPTNGIDNMVNHTMELADIPLNSIRAEYRLHQPHIMMFEMLEEANIKLPNERPGNSPQLHECMKALYYYGVLDELHERKEEIH